MFNHFLVDVDLIVAGHVTLGNFVNAFFSSKMDAAMTIAQCTSPTVRWSSHRNCYNMQLLDEYCRC